MSSPKREVAACVRAQRARTVALLESLAPGDWEQIVVPRWRVREVAAHLISTDEAALTGRMLRLGFAADMAAIERWNDEQVLRWAGRPVPALMHALERWGGRLARVISAVPSRFAGARLATPLGKVSLCWLGMMRVYDEWVHDEDVRRAFGLPSDDAREALEPVARHLFAALPQQTLPLLPRAATGRVAIRYEDLDLPAFTIDLGARRYGYGLGPPDATIRAPATTLIMVAAGRDPWRDAEAAGTLRIEGDRGAAETVLEVLRAV